MLDEQPKTPGFWITVGFTNSLFMYTPGGWTRVTSYFPDNPFLSEESMDSQRWFYANASFQELDRAGRVLIPDYLKALATIQDRVVLTGVKHHVEIWSPEAWARFSAKIGPSFDQVARKIHGQVSAQDTGAQ
jgi:MraZ protein